jgi:hypothetical protein
MTISLQWHPPITRPYSPASMPRFSLIGHLEEIDTDSIDVARLKLCYAKTHPDSPLWMPGSKIHVSYWARMVVEEIYWLGGFGDRAYIGWIPLDDFQSVTEDEITKLRLPGE